MKIENENFSIPGLCPRSIHKLELHNKAAQK